MFKLETSFINNYKNIEPSFGFNGLGKLAYLRTYSRLKLDGHNEQWYETVARVVEGTYSLQKKHIEQYNLGWNEKKAQDSAKEMYDRMFKMKFLPPGRGLWMMSPQLVEEGTRFAALNNCAFVSTKNLDKDYSKPFEFMMDMSMLGVGVGFDTKGEKKLKIKKSIGEFDYVIPDTREGWVNSLKLLLDAYFLGKSLPIFHYYNIREKGALIKGFGGKASGPEPLKYLHEQITNKLSNKINTLITLTDITDIMNMIGVCVVSGNVRRSAQIVFGDYNSDEYLKLKDYKYLGQDENNEPIYEGSSAKRGKHGWASNNTITCDIGMNYKKVAEQTATNGEPGYFWLENAKEYSRMNGIKDFKDHRATGGNPLT